MVQWHPLLLVETIVRRRGEDLIFAYSHYEVADPGLQAQAPRSAVIRVPAHDITSDWLSDRLAELGPREEMAWHSWVECKGMGFHIPMIDLVNSPSASALREVDCRLTGEMALEGRFMFFETGRSLHAYFPGLIREDSWPKYLGQLLLLNETDQLPIVDVRWVGHALTRGFAALRWSHNTSRYLAMPRLTRRLDLLRP